MAMRALCVLSVFLAPVTAHSHLKNMRTEVVVDHTGEQSVISSQRTHTGELSVISSQRTQDALSSDTMTINSPIVQIAAGGFTSFVLTKSGEVFGTGANSYGQLGDGTKSSKTQFTRLLGDMKYVSAAESTVLFLAKNGSAYAAGINGNPLVAWAQAGSGKRIDLAKGVTDAITSPKKIMDGVKQVAAGSTYHGFLKENGEVHLTGYQDTPLKVMDNAEGIIFEPVPLYLKDRNVYYTEKGGQPATKLTEGVSALASGPHVTLFFPSNGSHVMWEIDYRKLATGGALSVLVTTEAIQSIAAGDDWGILLTKGGDAYTIGKNSYGQLCDGTTSDRTTTFYRAATNVVAIAAGYYHSLFLKKDGKLLACGKNTQGELGVAKASLAETGDDSNGMLTAPTEILSSPAVNVADLVPTPSREKQAAPAAPASPAPTKSVASHMVGDLLRVPVVLALLLTYY